MKFKTTLLFLVMFTLFLSVAGQNNPKKIEIGFSMNQFQKDFGSGGHLISPYFLNSTVAVRVGFNLQWFEYMVGAETTWTLYQNLQLGLRARNSIIENKLFIYSEGGLVTIRPNSDFASESFDFGGYGVLGFEFKSSPRFSHFIELGGVGTGARADRVNNNPFYSNGFLTQVGLRLGI